MANIVVGDPRICRADAPLRLPVMKTATDQQPLCIFGPQMNCAPASTQGFSWLGFSMEKLRDSKGALAYYQDAVQADRNCITARERIAAIAVRLDNIDLAIEQYEALCHLEPEKSHLRTALGALNYRAGNYATATEIFQRAIAMEPENWSLVDQQVEALVADGEVREAIERLHMLVEEQGPFADLHLRLGDLYESIGDSSSALQQYLTAIDIQPMYLEALVKLGTHHLSNGRWEGPAIIHQACRPDFDHQLCSIGGRARQWVIDEAPGLRSSLEPNTTLLLTNGTHAPKRRRQ